MATSISSRMTAPARTSRAATNRLEAFTGLTRQMRPQRMPPDTFLIAPQRHDLDSPPPARQGSSACRHLLAPHTHRTVLGVRASAGPAPALRHCCISAGACRRPALAGPSATSAEMLCTLVGIWKRVYVTVPEDRPEGEFPWCCSTAPPSPDHGHAECGIPSAGLLLLVRRLQFRGHLQARRSPRTSCGSQGSHRCEMTSCPSAATCARWPPIPSRVLHELIHVVRGEGHARMRVQKIRQFPAVPESPVSVRS